MFHKKNNNLIFKTQNRFKSEKYNVFIEETNKIDLSSDDDKRMQSVDSLDAYVYGISNNLICKKETSKCNSIIKQFKKQLCWMMLQKKP